jgi:hypothetical protein
VKVRGGITAPGTNSSGAKAMMTGLNIVWGEKVKGFCLAIFGYGIVLEFWRTE